VGNAILRAGGVTPSLLPQEISMPSEFKVGDHVGWNSEAGHVSGTIIKVHVRDFDYKGHMHRASAEDPQYEIKSDKTDHVAAHRGAVLKKIARRAT
jgi:hypothetical protein